jgi:hypothetical protein
MLVTRTVATDLPSGHRSRRYSPSCSKAPMV